MKLLIAISSYRATDLTIDCLRSLNGELGGSQARKSQYARTGQVATRLIGCAEPSKKTGGTPGWTS